MEFRGAAYGTRKCSEVNDFLLESLVGGAVIGLAASLLLIGNGRVAGVSGILSALLGKWSEPQAWRVLFLFGLVAGGGVAAIFTPDRLRVGLEGSSLWILTAGFLVGFGSVLGSGCTSGHGVCGMSRLSLRSVIATIVFMFFGFLTVYLVRHF